MLAPKPIDSTTLSSSVHSKCRLLTRACSPRLISRSSPSLTVDEQLRTLIEQACHPDTRHVEQQKALNRLLSQIQQLPGILRSTHPDYAIALNQTLEWFCKNLAKFEERPPSLEKSLVVWINGYLKWRIQDLYTKSQADRKRQISLDAPIGEDSPDARTCLEQLGDPTPSLSTLEGYIEALQANRLQRQGQQLQQYIEQDPEGRLVQCHPRSAPHCHCQILALRLLLKEPPDRISTLACEFNVNNQTLYSHWKQKCLPLLREIGRCFIELP